MLHSNVSMPITLKHSPLPKHKKKIHCKTPPPLPEPSTKPYKSKFTASLEYFTKLYEESTKQTLNNNNNNNNKRFLTESTNTLHLSSSELPFKPQCNNNKSLHNKPKTKLTINNNSTIPNCSIYLTTNSNTKHNKSTSNIIIPKEQNIRTINKDKALPRTNLKHKDTKSASLISIHFHRNKPSQKNDRCTTPLLITNQAHINNKETSSSSLCVNNANTKVTKHNYDKVSYLSSSPSDKTTQQSTCTLNKQPSKKKYGYECYQLLKGIYTKIKQEEKFYNPDFNYKYTDYDNINYSICYDNENDDNKLFSICFELKDEILNTLSQLIDNFQKVKTSLINKHKITLEENKLFYKDITTCKETIRDYLVDSGNPNTNVYGTNDLVKVFKKTYIDFKNETKRKIEEKEVLVKDLRSYKIMVETYKNALNVMQSKVNVLKKENEGLMEKMSCKDSWRKLNEEVARLREDNEKMQRIINENSQMCSAFMKPVGDAVKRLVFEINTCNGKVREYLDIIFKLVGLNENEINEIYWMKENKKKLNTLTFAK